MNELSMMPVKDTPSSASSSVFFTHLGRNRLMSVSDAWNVPSIVASLTLRNISFCVSSALMTTSVRLQNCPSLNSISLQGLQPKSWLVSRLPFLATCLVAASLLKIPRSPDLDSYNECHSFMKIPMSGFSV
uniref:Uncharacterized protein n=1 Tax=Virus NIOZ-UU157 TaxID=2763269 RepID=A0A7S9SU83_9VIRU|nr:MAG: hypothetical protein NIOZUU157_00248 [Virus NIOZ-UU157]